MMFIITMLIVQSPVQLTYIYRNLPHGEQSNLNISEVLVLSKKNLPAQAEYCLAHLDDDSEQPGGVCNSFKWSFESLLCWL